MSAAPLDEAALCRALGARMSITVVARTGSTNADLLARAGDPATGDRTVLVAEHQDAGRGRRDRTWDARPAEGLTFSVLLRPREVPAPRWGWVPLLAGLALVTALDEVTGGAVPAALKWPNDLLLGAPDAPGKGAGILAEVAATDGPALGLVVGIGLNVRTARVDLPAGATSLLAEGADLTRHDVLVAVLRALEETDGTWRASGGDVAAAGLLAAYRSRCATLGRAVTVTLPGGRVLEGRAADVDADGRLVVASGGDTTVVSAGDVVHVRAAAR